ETSPVYEMECYADLARQNVPSTRNEAVFKEVFRESFEGPISFELIPSDYGFSVMAHRSTSSENIETNYFSYSRPLDCSWEEESGRCGQLSLSAVQTFDTFKAGESYSNELEKEEQWQFYIESPELI